MLSVICVLRYITLVILVLSKLGAVGRNILVFFDLTGFIDSAFLGFWVFEVVLG